jgi:phosphatidylserine/phosphatidylglycerophosphate/cardiolipin synthase-like enzyme
MKLELDAAEPEALAARPRRKKEPDLVEAVPKLIPPKLFPSKSFNPASPVSVTPVLTPDNYMDVVPPFLKGATKSILIEQQYIRSKHASVIELLSAIRQAREKHPGLDVRIILGKLFGPADVKKEKENVANLAENFGLKLGDNIRYIDLKRFVHCHNKLVVVDGAAALVSSQNWSETGVGSNREAGVLVRYPAVVRYYAEIFESDWGTASKTIQQPKSGGTVTPKALARGGFVRVSAADYQEV